MDHTTPPPVRVEPWSPADLDLLHRANAPELMHHLGGPETEEQVQVRHARYVELSADRTGRGRMFRIVLLDGPGPALRWDATGAARASGEAVGTIGFWEQTWEGETVYETGWSVLPPYQGRGIAAAATRAIVAHARAARKHRALHAFPAVDNGPSNGVCRKAGFVLVGPCDLEYPPGRPVRSNNWRLDLTGP